MPMTRRYQFSLRTLFGIVTYIAVYLATATWVLAQNIPIGSWELPVLCEPYHFMGFGITVVPLLSLGMVIGSFVFTFRSQPRAVTNYFYFACVPLILGGLQLDSSNAVRWLASLCVGSAAFLIEVLVRKLPREQLIAALLAMGGTAGFYLFILSATAIASV